MKSKTARCPDCGTRHKVIDDHIVEHKNPYNPYHNECKGSGLHIKYCPEIPNAR